MYVVKKGDEAFFYCLRHAAVTCGAWALLNFLDFPIGAAAIDQTFGPGTPGGGHM
jgi:hypothetical protein